LTRRIGLDEILIAIPTHQLRNDVRSVHEVGARQKSKLVFGLTRRVGKKP
jgi:hypothetical protein